MTHLSTNDFLFIADVELNQYKILGALKHYKEEFNKKDFTKLSQLSSLASSLIRVEKKRGKLLDLFPVPVKRIDNEGKKLIFDGFVLYNEDIERTFELIKWAIPVIHDTIDEGICLTQNFKNETFSVLAE
ncbi:MAG: hypothetical protein WCJ01_10875 [Ignavibacteria bacterium]